MPTEMADVIVMPLSMENNDNQEKQLRSMSSGHFQTSKGQEGNTDFQRANHSFLTRSPSLTK